MDKQRNQILQDIHIALSKDTHITERNKQILSQVLDGLRAEMMKDPLFAEIFKRFSYTGSSYEGLRIRRADEFDINLIMELPVHKGKFEIFAERPGYVSYKITADCKKYLKDNVGKPELHALSRLFDEDLKLHPKLWREWFQSVVDKARNSYTPPLEEDGSKSFELTARGSGPARTLHVDLPDKSVIDIDLVPVLEHGFDHLPERVRRCQWYNKVSSEQNDSNKWVMVPKPLKDDDSVWRMNFPDVEKKLMKDWECMKPTIRLIKALRDRHKWALSSYSMKTVVIRHRLEKEDKVYWQNENRWTVLIDVLKRLRENLDPSGPGIRYVFDDDVSLIPDMSVDTRKNIAQRLQKILNVLAKEPNRARMYFLEQDEGDRGSSRTVKESSCEPLVISSSATEACAVSSSTELGSRNSVDNIIDERPHVTSVNMPSYTNAIVISQEVVSDEMQHQDADNDVQVTLCALADGNRLLVETSCDLHSCPGHSLQISMEMLEALTAPSLLVLKQRFELADEAALPRPVQTVLTVMTEGRPLVKAFFSLQLHKRVEECQVCVPFPQLRGMCQAVEHSEAAKVQ